MNMIPKEVLKNILVLHNGAKTYKAIIATCWLWRKLVMCANDTNHYMNALSTLVARHTELNWKWHEIGSYLTEDAIIKYIYSNSFKNRGLKLKYINYNLDHKFILEYFGKIKWRRFMVGIIGLDFEFVTNNINDTDLTIIGENRGWTMELIYKYVPLFDDDEWINISRYSDLSLEFIEQYQDKLDWMGLSMQSIHIMDLITLYPHKVLLIYIDANDNLPYSYICENWKELDDGIYLHRNFTMDLVNEINGEMVDFVDYLLTNPNLSHEFIIKHWDEINNMYYLSCNNLQYDLLTDNQRDKLWPNMSFIRVLMLNQLEANIDKLKGICYD